MGRIFLQISLLLAIVFMAGCSRSEITPIDLPTEVSSVADPFLAAIKAGDRRKANRYVDRYTLDDTADQFEPAHADLEASPKLVPVAFSKKQVPFGVDENEVTVVYLARKNKDWVSARIRLGRVGGEAFKVEYWDVTYGPDKPQFLKKGEEFRWFMGGFMGLMGIGGIFVLAFLIWLALRKAHFLSPPVPEERQSAVITRDPEK